MSDFLTAFKNTLGHEIGYSHNPNDAGGETYNGIARRFHSHWTGWLVIDKAKLGHGFPNNIPHKSLQLDVEAFYRKMFWIKIKGSDMPDQDIAEWTFDIAVNGGVDRAGRYFQRTLNLLNRNERDYSDLKVDGMIGKLSIAALKKFLSRRDKNVFLLFLSNFMVTHWVKRIEENPDQEEFANGVGNRWIANQERVADKFYLNEALT